MADDAVWTEDQPRAATVLGRVMLLVALAVGILALGALVSRDVSPGGGLACSFGALGMLVVQFFGGERFSLDRVATIWLLVVAALIGLGLGPVLEYYGDVDPAAITGAAAATAVVFAAVGGCGLILGRDLARWTAPISLGLMGLIGVSLVRVLFGGAGSRLLNVAIGGVSALLILVDFNFRRHRPTEHVPILATGIAVAVVNLFVSLLSLLGEG